MLVLSVSFVAHPEKEFIDFVSNFKYPIDTRLLRESLGYNSQLTRLLKERNDHSLQS